MKAVPAVSASANPGLAALLSLALAGCGAPAPATPAASQPAPAARAAAVEPAVLELGEMTMFDVHGPTLRVHASGSTEIFSRQVWVAGPTIKPDGSIEGHGRLLARVHADGTITDPTGQPRSLKVQDDFLAFTGTTHAAGIQLAPDGGMIPRPSGSAPGFRVEGADTPGKRRTVLALFGTLYFGPPPTESFDPPGATTAPVK